MGFGEMFKQGLRKFGSFISETVAPKLGQLYRGAMATPILGSVLRAYQVPKIAGAIREAYQTAKSVLQSDKKPFEGGLFNKPPAQGKTAEDAYYESLYK